MKIKIKEMLNIFFNEGFKTFDVNGNKSFIAKWGETYNYDMFFIDTVGDFYTLAFSTHTPKRQKSDFLYVIISKETSELTFNFKHSKKTMQPNEIKIFTDFTQNFISLLIEKNLIN